MSIGNYDFLNRVKEPYAVATYFKNVLKNMGEPLCTFDLYERF